MIDTMAKDQRWFTIFHKYKFVDPINNYQSYEIEDPNYGNNDSKYKSKED